MQTWVAAVCVVFFWAAAPTTHAYIAPTHVTRGPHDANVHTVAIRTGAAGDARAVAREHGFHYVGPILPGYHLLERPIEHRNRSLDKLAQAVSWYQEQKTFVRVKRQPLGSRRSATPMPPLDPLWPEQWHLHSTDQGLPHLGAVSELWDRGVDGRGVTIAIVDDGLQHRHPDIAPNYRAPQSRDVSYDRDDPNPHPEDSHGTAAAGTAAAKRNAVCGVGVAPGAGISGIRVLTGDVTDAREGMALSYMCDQGNDIYSNSWGPTDDGLHIEGPLFLTAEAIRSCVERGRGGRGAIYVWAAGNGRHRGDDVNNDGYANSRFTIAVGALTDQGRNAYYSEPGAALLCVAPSSGGTRSIYTTDLLGSDGVSATDCTSQFGGTSAACPMVAGLGALMLQVNSRLGWRDVQHVLIRACNRVDLESVSWDRNGAGLWHSHDYGFGLPDASAAVELARSWVNVPTPVSAYSSGDRSTTASQLSAAAGEEVSIPWECPAGPAGSFSVEHVELTVNLSSPLGRGRAQIVLCAPSGMCSILSRARENDAAPELHNWTYMSLRHWGEGCQGTWTLRLKNVIGDAERRRHAERRRPYSPPVVIHSWRIQMYGYRIPGTF